MEEDEKDEGDYDQALKAVGLSSDSHLEKQFIKYLKASQEVDSLRRKSKKYKVIIDKLQELGVRNSDGRN